ncbi:TIGR03750 family conjugal transfer protein [Dyadobacter sp. CY261]|uniref:TIGR03750 family conjugal transfer protein n=1 Tax=Dyadobacter sp. CY261 TaxID=2907203 RepID=UPI001F256472|nr:TIGR03750 family conjugal transfer protein [Dyadobacter sp. CY261]MCF0075097.1 TIGR03750 family conjugal transfer protein [Dyadobacter sp. CY261]
MAKKKELQKQMRSARELNFDSHESVSAQGSNLDELVIYVNQTRTLPVKNRHPEVARAMEEARLGMAAIEGEVRFWRMMEEGAGLVVTGSGIVLGALAATVVAPAGAVLGGAVTLSFPLIAGSVLGALQLGSGFAKMFYLTISDDEMLEWMENDKTLKAAYFVIDFAGVIISIVGILPALKSAVLNLGPKLSQFRTFLANSKINWETIWNINREILFLKNDLAKGIKEFKNTKFPIGGNRLAQSEALKDLGEKGAKLRNCLKQYKQEIRKWDDLYVYKKVLEDFQKDLLEPLMKLLQGKDTTKILETFKVAFLEKRDDISNLVTLVSLYANATPGHGIATGSLSDIKELAPKVMNKTSRESELTDDFNELMYELKLIFEEIPEPSLKARYLEATGKL